MENYIGRLLDNRYEIVEMIGVGGMAVVYKALDHRLNRLVAVKVLKPEFNRDAEFVGRFQREAEAASKMTHHNIVNLLDVGMDGENRRDLRRLFPGDPDGKCSLLLDWTNRPRDVADPWYTRDFGATWRDVLEGCTALLAALSDPPRGENISRNEP